MSGRTVSVMGLAWLALSAASCAAKAAPVATVTVCGGSVAVSDVSPPPLSGPVVLMVTPCLVHDDGTPVVPQNYRRLIELQASRPLDGVWVPYDETTMQIIDADYRRLWSTGRLSDLTVDVTDHVFPNGVVGKLVTYTLREASLENRR